MTSQNDEQDSQIGCIDGSVLQVTRSDTQIDLHIGNWVAQLSLEAADLLAALLRPYDPRPAPRTLPSVGRLPRLMGTGINPSVADLINEDYLEAGTELTLWHRGNEYVAKAAASGEIVYEDEPYGSLSAAAKAATGTVAVNGWAAWHVGEDSPISDLRWWLRANHFPGEGHQYADSTATEKQMIACRWVEHALSEALDPTVYDEVEVEFMLSGNDYTEGTKRSYRSHVRHWCALYGRAEATAEVADGEGAHTSAAWES